MATYAICYDLNRPGQSYTDLIEKIKSLGTWWHYLDSTWLVVSPRSASEIRDFLSPRLDQNDELLVLGLSRAWAGTGFEDRAYQWIRNNL